ncbi:MAG TPA: outer membrane beta-barrel protein [Chitinophagaceae bacterium]|nr:outer membrane beta-barrel protein [Chitinophagaceae bacterium]
MKKNFFCLFFLMAGLVEVNAQNSSTFFKAGVNLANVSYNANGNVDEANMLLSFQAGIVGNISIAPFLSIQPGLIISGKGSKTQSGNTNDANYYRATSNPWYVEIPVNLVLNAAMENNSKFIFGAGPYAAMGIAGKRKAEGRVFGVAFNREENITFSNDDPTTSGEEGAGFGIMKRFDYGLNGLVGIEGKKTMLVLNYGWGLAKLQSGTNNTADNNNKHRVLSLTLGFKL